jgi:hypothetical protein
MAFFSTCTISIYKFVQFYLDNSEADIAWSHVLVLYTTDLLDRS